MQDSKRACDILGIQEITDFTKVPNCNSTYTTELMQRVEAIILKYNIDTVFMYSENDMNHDHVEAARICKVAACGIEHQRSMANGQNNLFENIIYQNRIWGYAIDAMYAEGFEVIKEVH